MRIKKVLIGDHEMNILNVPDDDTIFLLKIFTVKKVLAQAL